MSLLLLCGAVATTDTVVIDGPVSPPRQYYWGVHWQYRGRARRDVSGRGEVRWLPRRRRAVVGGRTGAVLDVTSWPVVRVRPQAWRAASVTWIVPHVQSDLGWRRVGTELMSVGEAALLLATWPDWPRRVSPEGVP